jgi:hypothetical protein
MSKEVLELLIDNKALFGFIEKMYFLFKSIIESEFQYIVSVLSGFDSQLNQILTKLSKNDETIELVKDLPKDYSKFTEEERILYHMKNTLKLRAKPKPKLFDSFTKKVTESNIEKYEKIVGKKEIKLHIDNLIPYVKEIRNLNQSIFKILTEVIIKIKLVLGNPKHELLELVQKMLVDYEMIVDVIGKMDESIKEFETLPKGYESWSATQISVYHHKQEKNRLSKIKPEERSLQCDFYIIMLDLAIKNQEMEEQNKK